jgi:hypothetical protein
VYPARRRDATKAMSALPSLRPGSHGGAICRERPLRDIPPTSDGSLMTVGFVVVLRNVAQSAAAWLAGSQTRWAVENWGLRK